MTILLILDGAGLAPPNPKTNAVRPDTMPQLYKAMNVHGHAVLSASGEAVGLGPGQAGNSEVGHITIGAGRKVPSKLATIEAEYQSGAFSANPLWNRLNGQEVVHVAGLLSDAGTHGHWRSLVRTARIASGFASRVIVHPVLDGVDSQAGTAPQFLRALEGELTDIAEIGVVMGRRCFCDRSGDVSLSRVYAESLDTVETHPTFDETALFKHLETATEASFPPHTVTRLNRARAPLILTQNREDRVRQVAKELKRRGPVFSLIDIDGVVPAKDAFFPKAPLTDGLSHRLRASGISTRRVSERCKFPHVTFFLNGLHEGEATDGICLPSWPEDALAQHPEMAATEITEAVIAQIENPNIRVIIANLPNLDQIGHLGDLSLAEHAAGHVDRAVGLIRQAAAKHGRHLVLTADHGNAEMMVDTNGKAFSSHTTNPVPFTVVPPPGSGAPDWALKQGSLANVAATIMILAGVEPPAQFEPPLLHPIAAQSRTVPEVTA